MTPRPLGRLAPLTWEHVERFPFAAPAPAVVEHTLRLPPWYLTHDQGREGSCVGHAVVLERAITNRLEARAHGVKRVHVRYDPIVLWRAAKAIDEWPSTKPEDDRGTSLKAAYEISRVNGLYSVRAMHVENGRPYPVAPIELDTAAGVSEYRWARTVDEVRAAIAAELPVAIGIDWYSGFDTPELHGRERWLPETAVSGRIRGGHSVCLYGASDRREAFKLANSWGADYPPVWMSYATLATLLRRQGEAALVTDRVAA